MRRGASATIAARSSPSSGMLQQCFVLDFGFGFGFVFVLLFPTFFGAGPGVIAQCRQEARQCRREADVCNPNGCGD